MAENDREIAEIEPFETRRWHGGHVRVFAAMDTMPQIAERVLAVVGEGRVMNKISTYVHRDGLKDLSNLDHATGLRKGGHAGHPEGHSIWQRDDQAGFTVYLTHNYGSLGTMEGFGAGVMAYNAATEKAVRARYEHSSEARDVFDRRRDITYLEIKGRPGEPHRDDRIEILDWNQHGVLRHTIITFVEPDWCDSGRLMETKYVVLGHRKDPDRKPYTTREEEAETLGTFAYDDDGRNAAHEMARNAGRNEWDYVWVATDTITHERRYAR